MSMNLTGMLKEASLTNLEWLSNPETFEPQDGDINKKDDIIMEWTGGMNLSVEQLAPTTIKDEMQLKTPPSDVDFCVRAANILLHQGIMEKEMIAQLKSHFPVSTIEEAVPQLGKLIKNQGIVGCMVLDLRKEKDLSAIITAAQRSPYKRHIHYVLMTEDQIRESSLVERKSIATSTSAKVGIDGFFDSTDCSVASRPYYAPLDMTIISSIDVHDEFVDPEYYEKTMLELGTLGDIDQEEMKEIMEKEASRGGKLKRAFLLAARKRSKTVDSSTAPVADFAIDPSIMSVDIPKAVGKPQIDIEDVNQGLFGVAVSNPTKAPAQIDVSGIAPSISSFDIDTVHSSKGFDNIRAEFADIEIESAPAPSPLSVDPSTYISEEFKGADIFQLDEKKAPPGELDINLNGGFNF